MDKLLSIGKIVNFHGMKGEVKVGYTPGKESQLEQVEKIIAFKGSDKTVLTLENIRFHKKYAIIKFKELNHINESSELKGAILKIGKSEIKQTLNEDEYFIDELVGLDSYTTKDEFIGKIKYVANQGSGHLLGIKDKDGNEHLVPFVKDLVPEVRIKEKKVIINAIPGLIEKPENTGKE